ncbi:MAG: sn-glycerol-1-phosphate dehydrogenase [Anaerolineae bacterium]|nr:sn-glycerol-1-phosphate dehydrogenase [Anaerolineae bacterium]
MTKIDPIYVGHNAAQHLIEYCGQQGLKRFCMISDNNTYAALGSQVEAALKAAHLEVTSLVLTGAEIIADEHYLIHVLINAPLGECTFISVGTGTLTDITRFVSHRTGRSFISMPTAPSVDGFTSVGAPLVVGGVKTTILCQAPIAVFADLDTMTKAPHRLIAAGFGDMIGKITSLADWKLGSLLWEEPFDQTIYNRSEAAINQCISHADEIGQQTEAGVRYLMDALIESGLCMLDFGNSRPASGAEHHASHYWEMKLLREHRPAILHGAKVGYALMLVADRYAKVRALSRKDMLDRLEGATLPSKQQEAEVIHAGYGALADDVMKEHAAFLNLTEAGFDTVKQRIADKWDAIQDVAEHVPPPEQIKAYLSAARAITDAKTLGLGEDEVKLGFQYGHYLRNRFTVLKLNRILGLPLT